MSKSKNDNLKVAKKAKNDEFYTQLGDIEKELSNYKEHFKNKVVFCNCDDPTSSNFYVYFSLNFKFLGLKKLITTHYNQGKSSYKLEMFEDKDGKTQEVKTVLVGDGDFRSEESIEILKESDIVCTNPPFSLFREYVAQLMKYEKKFIIIGNLNAITYKEIFKLIIDGKIWLGSTYFNGGAAYFVAPKELYDPSKMSNKKNAYVKDDLFYWRVNGVRWFTNLEHRKRKQDILLFRKYEENQSMYPNYENYEAIEVSKANNIPMDYFGCMGVPISFLDKFNPDQFDIVALGITGSIDFTSNRKMEIIKKGEPTGKFTFNAKGTLYRKYNPLTDEKPAFKDCLTGDLYSSIYARIIIKRVKKD